MCKSFLKLNLDTEAAVFLATNYPNAFTVLFLIARRARRNNGNDDGLIIGDALIGSTDLEPGMSRQNFRTSINKLVELGYIEIIANGKNFLKREKSTIKVTIRGLLVNLIKSTIWDINSDDANHQSNQRLTNGQPTANHEQERIRKKKKEKEESSPTPSLDSSKIKFREFVELSQVEYDSLLKTNGQEFLNHMLDTLDAYKGSSGRKYDSDFHTMKQGGWVVNRVKKDLQQASNEKLSKFTQGGKSSGDIKPSETPFQPGRILRGSNNEPSGSIDKGLRNE